MKIALIGFGNMGQEIAAIIKKSKEFEIVSISYKDKSNKLDINGIKKADVAIDFTSSEVVQDNIKIISELGINMVVGTTGWYSNLSIIKSIVKENKIGFIYGQNFSVGANIFFKIISYASKLISNFDYDVYGFEMHHSGKKDSPSGTAKKISKIILDNFSKKQILQAEKLDRQIMQEEFHFASIRGGNNPGFHEVIFDSFADELKISHQAHNRSGFAKGALIAAKFIQNKNGIYSFDEVFIKGGDIK